MRIQRVLNAKAQSPRRSAKKVVIERSVTLRSLRFFAFNFYTLSAISMRFFKQKWLKNRMNTALLQFNLVKNKHGIQVVR
jgi:hypothetical protein